MKISKKVMTHLLRFGVVLSAVAAFTVGCEWTGTSSDDSWNESMSWVNFTGLYRGTRGGQTLVSDFSTAPGQMGDNIETRVVGQDGGTEAAPFTVLTGTIPFTGGNIKPGSLSINLRATGSGAQGQFEDNGDGTLQGSFAQVPPASPMDGTGSINYETGVFRINLDALYLDEASITFSYVIEGGGAPANGGADGGSEGIRIVGGPIASIQIEQLGNKLTFTTSNGHVLNGQLSVVTLPGGDTTGRSAGDVSATYEVSGDIDGQNVRISGTLSGVYVPPADISYSNPQAPIVYGILSQRILQGIWMQPNGTADVYGVAPQQSVPINVGDFQPVVPEDEPREQTTTSD